MSFELFVAKRYLRSPRKDRSISIITKIAVGGVALGVIVLIVVMSLINGMQYEQKQALRGAEGDLTVYNMSSRGLSLQNIDSLIDRINETVEIEASAPFTHHQALIIGPSQKRFPTLIRGIDIKKEPEVVPIYFHIREILYDVKRDNRNPDRELKDEDRERSEHILSQLIPHLEMVASESTGEDRKVKVSGIILGSHLAKNLGVSIGDSVAIMTLETRMTPMGEIPRFKKFKVVGYSETGMLSWDEYLSYIDIGVGQKVFNMKDKVSGVTLRILDSDNAEKYRERLSSAIPFPYYFTTWMDSYKNLLEVIRLEKLALAIILTLIILLASFLIVCSLIMLVVEKAKDIAILKAMGAKNSAIRKIFIYQGSFIGLLGTGIGVGLGLLVCWVIARFDIIDIPAGVYVSNRIPVHINPIEIVITAIASILICFFVTIIPSRKASSLDPIEGMRNE